MGKFFESDESNFYLDGYQKTKNTVKWVAQRPANRIRETSLNKTRTGVGALLLYGPYFYCGNVKAQVYCDIIRNFARDILGGEIVKIYGFNRIVQQLTLP